MADEPTTTRPKTTGKTFNFNLTGNDLDLYEFVRGVYQGAVAADDAAVTDALAGLDPQVRALVEARLGAQPAKKELSQRQVFARALADAKAYNLLDDAVDPVDLDDVPDDGPIVPVPAELLEDS